MFRQFMLLSLCLLSGLLPSGYAQTVINTEDMRLRADTNEVKGSINLDFGMSRNKAGLYLRPGIDARLEYYQGKNRWLFLGGYALTRFSDLDIPGASAKTFNNRGFTHLRFNRSVSGRLTLEAFAQYQFDLIQEIDYRILTGLGPRIRWTESEEGFFFTGASYMFENERTDDEEQGVVYNRHHRLSFYASAGVKFNDNVSLNSTTYFQPRPDIWSDFRVSTVNTLNAALTESLGFRTTVNFIYDSRPPLSVPEVMYNISAGFTVVW